MGRLNTVRDYVDAELSKVPDPAVRKAAYVHLFGVQLAATLISEKRKQNTELAAIAALLHDLYAFTRGTYEDHAHKGAELARQILDELAITTPEETDAVCSAIYNHDDKLSVSDRPLDEVLKDADVMHHTMNDLSKPVKDKELGRYRNLRKEFGLDV